MASKWKLDISNWPRGHKRNFTVHEKYILRLPTAQFSMNISKDEFIHVLSSWSLRRQKACHSRTYFFTKINWLFEHKYHTSFFSLWGFCKLFCMDLFITFLLLIAPQWRERTSIMNSQIELYIRYQFLEQRKKFILVLPKNTINKTKNNFL